MEAISSRSASRQLLKISEFLSSNIFSMISIL
jgi:hypothetical protein